MTTYPLINGEDTRVSKEDEATATCFCGAVQLAFPTKAPGLVDTFVCNCTDCRKITASMVSLSLTRLASFYQRTPRWKQMLGRCPQSIPSPHQY